MKILAWKNWLLLPLLLAGGSADASINIGFNTQSQSATALEIAVVVSGLSDASAPSLGSYDLDIQFDGAHLAFVGAVFGDPLLGNQLDVLNFGANAVAADLIAPGLLNLFELSLDTPQDLNLLQADTFTLATLSFDIVNTGGSQLTIAINALGDADGNALAAITTPATISAIPLPSAFWLMLGGLTMLSAKSRRR